MIPVLTEIAAGAPEMLFFPIFQPEGDFIVQQASDVAGMDGITLMAADGLMVSNFMEIPETEGMYFSGPDLRYGGNRNQRMLGSSADSFITGYVMVYGEKPSAAFWAHAYDATTLLLDAIEAASYEEDDGTLVIDRAGVREFLSNVRDYQGITGLLSCDEFGEAPAAPFWAHSYDAAVLLMDAISAASYDDGGTLVIDRAGVREYLNGVSNYSGLIGSMSCDAFGDCSSAKITVIQNTDIADYAASTANVVYEYAPLGGAQVGEVAVGAGPLDRGELSMCRANWASGYVQAEIVRQVLQSAGYGVSDPSAMELGPATAYMTMASGECDFWANSWYPNHYSWYENELPDGSLVSEHVEAVDGLFQDSGVQGWLITKSWADAEGIVSMDQINDTPALYEALDTDGDGVGEILGCPEDWTCDDTQEQMIAFAGWDNLVQTKAGYDALFAEFVNRVRAGDPGVMYTWTPSSYVVEMVPGVDVYWLSIEEDSVLDDSNPLGMSGGESQSQGDGFRDAPADTCTQPCQLGWEAADIQVSARSDVLAGDPYLHNLLVQIRPSILDISILQVEQTNGDGSEAHVQELAAGWMADNADIVAGWREAASAG